MAAYLYAEGAGDPPPPIPDELIRLSYVDRFGVKAVFGRDTLSAREIRDMVTAENVVRAYYARSAAMEHDVVAWAKDNPDAERLLIEIEKVLNATD